ncbi:MAG: Hsp20/alpha crystallin family protein [Desulfovibrionaceae bacterium]|nr:Hsp20/alpha crystallin family protein [Desulfovibrionaceae bacterium]
MRNRYHIFFPDAYEDDANLGENTRKLFKAFMPQRQAQSFSPALDIVSDANSYTVYAEIPGVSKDEVKLEVRAQTLVLTGEKKDVSEDAPISHVNESLFGVFERAIALPEDADIDNIKASHKDGVLIITIPKIQPKDTHKTITIN